MARLFSSSFIDFPINVWLFIRSSFPSLALPMDVTDSHIEHDIERVLCIFLLRLLAQFAVGMKSFCREKMRTGGGKILFAMIKLVTKCNFRARKRRRRQQNKTAPVQLLFPLQWHLPWVCGGFFFISRLRFTCRCPLRAAIIGEWDKTCDDCQTFLSVRRNLAEIEFSSRECRRPRWWIN